METYELVFFELEQWLRYYEELSDHLEEWENNNEGYKAVKQLRVSSNNYDETEFIVRVEIKNNKDD